MREIKFRVWYKHDNPPRMFNQVNEGGHTMRFVHYVHQNIHPLTYDFEVPFLDDDWIIEQFTGLTDKNGKEIYEGDIVDIHQTVNGCNLFEIVWDKTRWNARYVVKMNTPRLYEYDFEQLMEIELKYPPYEKEIEVIGNIHENPELLKGVE
jgi:uncharacterized phage protein (TIGR01671 family)